MFSLIIVIISISLVAALAIATVWFGGDAYTDWRASTESAKLINEANQIVSAIELYERIDHQRDAIEPVDRGGKGLEHLAPKYLSNVPDGWTVEQAPSLSGEGDEIFIQISEEHFSELSCYLVNDEIGYNDYHEEHHGGLEEGEAPECDVDLGINKFPFVCCF